MPYIRIETNVSKSKIAPGFMQEFCELTAKLLDKKVHQCCVNILPDQFMSYGGDDELCAQVIIRCIGGMGVVENNTTCKEITEKLGAAWGVKPHKINVHIMQISLEETGWEGKTFVFHDHFRKME